MIKVIIFVSLLWLVPAAVVFPDYQDDSRLQAILRSVSSPKLVYPVNQEVELGENDSLEFRWELFSESRVSRESVEFRLYSGDKIDESRLIMVKPLPPETFSLRIETARFESAGTYTWLIRQFVLRGEYGGESAVSFRVNKTGNKNKELE